MSVETRPTDQITPAHLLIGMPYVEFGALDSVTGAYDPYRNLGIVDSAEIQKTLTAVQLVSAQSGIQTLIRELIARIEARMQIGVFNFDPYNMQLFLGSSSLTPVSGGAATSTDEGFTLTDDPLDFLDLDHPNITSMTAVSAAEIAGENVGVGDGTLGDASGDYSLDYKVRIYSDVSSLTVGGTAYTPRAVGGASSGLEVEIVDGTGADSGDLQFFSAGTPVNVTGTILATYEPSWVLAEGLPGGVAGAIGYALSDDGGVFTDETTDANSAALDDVTLTPATPVVNDAFYFGKKNGAFDRIRLKISSGQEGSDYTITWEYSQGGASWAALSNVTDPSAGFTVAGDAMDVTFDMPSDWVADTVNNLEALWIRARVSAIGTPSGATGSQIWISDSGDFVVDTKRGTIQVHHDASKAAGFRGIIAGQPMECTYGYTEIAHDEIKPLTQTTFAGRAKVRLLTDVGINIVWEIPSAAIQLTDDPFAFSRDEFGIGNLQLTIYDAGGTDRYGTMKMYDETP